jgi:hypothetical protein
VEALLDPVGEHQRDPAGAACRVALAGRQLAGRAEADRVDGDLVDVARGEERLGEVERRGQPLAGRRSRLLPAVLVRGQAAHRQPDGVGELDEGQPAPLAGQREPARSERRHSTVRRCGG